MFDTEKCCVEIEFKACFRDFLRYGLYSSCGCDKLSEAQGASSGTQSLGTARLTCFARAIERSKTRVWRLALAPLCVFYQACVTQRPMRAVKF